MKIILNRKSRKLEIQRIIENIVNEHFRDALKFLGTSTKIPGCYTGGKIERDITDESRIVEFRRIEGR